MQRGAEILRTWRVDVDTLAPAAARRSRDAGLKGTVDGTLNTFTDVLSNFHIGVEAVAGKFDEVVTDRCGGLVSAGVGSLAGLPQAFGQYEEAIVSYEMSPIGSPFNSTPRTYTGLGGALPEVFFVNFALCGLLVDVFAKGLLENSVDSL